jgi:hypothetical protein
MYRDISIETGAPEIPVPVPEIEEKSEDVVLEG